MEPTEPTMSTALTTAITDILGGLSDVWEWLNGETVLPFFMLGVAAAVILLGVTLVKRLVWGA